MARWYNVRVFQRSEYVMNGVGGPEGPRMGSGRGKGERRMGEIKKLVNEW